MSFSFRDKGRLSDRLRGKTCDEILKELRDHLHHDRSMSFEPSPSWGGFSSNPAFSRAGFPFMDQDMMSSPDMRAHFEDLASRHPEFAEHLRPAAWNTVPETDPHFFHPPASGPNMYRQRHSSGGSGSGSFCEGEAIPIPVIHEDSGGGGPPSSRSRTRKIPQYGMRNTVDLGESQKSNPADMSEADLRSQRSWSAPPDNRTQGEAPQPKRFVTRIDVNNSPTNPTSSGEGEASPAPSASNVSSPGKPPPFPKQTGAGPAPQSTTKQGNVRHIPIFVEGRDEPLLPKPNEGSSFSSSHSSSHSSSGFGQPSASYSHASATPGSHSAAFASSFSPSGSTRSQSSAPHPQASGTFPRAGGPFSHAGGPFPFAGGHFPHTSASHPQTSAPHPQASAPQKPKHETPPPQPHPQPPKQVLPKDPIARVQVIQEEVNELKKKVESFSGSRSDKEYIYLDEMLTRNLLKLDDIETEGKDNIRQARKEAIRLIEKCISLLESKAPLPQETNGGGAEQSQTTDITMEEKSCPDISADVSQDETVASAEVTKVPLEPMEVQQKSNAEEPTDPKPVNTEVTMHESLQSETPMDVDSDGKFKDGVVNDSVLELKTKEATQNLEMMEVTSENKRENESQHVAASNLQPSEVEVQMVGGEGGEKTTTETATVDGTNSGHCEKVLPADSTKENETISAGTEVKINETATSSTEKEKSASGEPVGSDEGLVKISDSSEPVNTQNAQDVCVECKDSESAANAQSKDITNVTEIPPLEAPNKDVSS